MAAVVRIKLGGPFNLPLSLEAAASFLPATDRIPQSLRLAIWMADRPAIIEIRQKSSTPATIEASAAAAIPRSRVEELALLRISQKPDSKFANYRTSVSLNRGQQDGGRFRLPG